MDVVVHGLRDRDDRDAFLVKPQRERQRVVTADGDHGVDPDPLEDPEDVLRVISRLVAGTCASQELGLVGRLHLRGVRSRSVEERPARSVDRANDTAVERHRVLLDRGGIVRITLEEARPPAPDADHLMTLLNRAVHHGLDAGVQSGDVSSAGQDPDPHGTNLLRHLQIEEHLGEPVQLIGNQTSPTHGFGELNVDDLGASERDHPSPAAGGRQVDRPDPEPGGEDAVLRVGRPTSLHVSQDRHPRLVAGLAFDLGRDVMRDPTEAREPTFVYAVRERREGSFDGAAPSATTTIE